MAHPAGIAESLGHGLHLSQDHFIGIPMECLIHHLLIPLLLVGTESLLFVLMTAHDVAREIEPRK